VAPGLQGGKSYPATKQRKNTLDQIAPYPGEKNGKPVFTPPKDRPQKLKEY
jgi:hypothetical protein